VLLYEYPLNERVRTLLRLEDTFERFDFFAAQDHALSHHSALGTLFDILEIGSRSDLKTDLLQELERQRQTLNNFRSSPDVALAALDDILAEIDVAWNSVNAMTGKTGQHLRDNEWLMSIRSRTIIAGGACEFDLPSYYAWQNRDAASRREDIMAWAAPFRPLYESLKIVLKLLRESGHRQVLQATSNGFQLQLAGKTYQMAQVRVNPATGAIPEVSANKYVLWIRFTTQGGDLRPKAFEGNVDFELSLCNL
jgi:cell division protein ZapD